MDKKVEKDSLKRENEFKRKYPEIYEEVENLLKKLPNEEDIYKTVIIKTLKYIE
jgi:hypothetical protein